MSQCRRPSVYLHRSGIPAHSVPKVDVGAHSTPSRSSTHRASSSVAQYGMSWLSHLWRINTQVSPSSSRPQKLLSKSSSRGLKYLGRHYWRPPDKLQKVCLHVGSYVVAAGWLMAHLFADAKNGPQGAIGSEVAGVGNATTGSVTDKLTRDHRMTLDEAHLILNAKRGEVIERIVQVRPSRRSPLYTPSQ